MSIPIKGSFFRITQQEPISTECPSAWQLLNSYTLNTTENTSCSFSSWGLGFAGWVFVGWFHKLAKSAFLFTLTAKLFRNPLLPV